MQTTVEQRSKDYGKPTAKFSAAYNSQKEYGEKSLE
jgi:hypothetical protein